MKDINYAEYILFYIFLFSLFNFFYFTKSFQMKGNVIEGVC